MGRIPYVIAAAILAVATGNAVAKDPPDFGDDMRAAQVAWKPVKAIDARTISIRGPRVTYCSNKPSLETVLTEDGSQVIIDAYSVRPTGRETKCRRRKVLETTVTLSRGLDGRQLYDGRFSPPRLRPLPVVPGETIPSP